MNNLQKDVIESFRLQNYYAENSYLCGAGVNHEQFVDLAAKHKSLKSSGLNVNSSTRTSVYKGGLLMSQES